MPELKYVISGDESGIKASFKRVQAESAKTSSQVVKDFEKTRDASAKATTGIMSDAVKLRQKGIKLEVGTGDASNGNTGTAVNANNAKRAAEANAAYAQSTLKVTAAKVSETVATKAATVAQVAQQKSVEQLTIKVAAYERVVRTSTDPAIISAYNKKITQTSAEVTRLTNLGKPGFDKMGNAIKSNISPLAGVWSGLKSIATLIPGMGLATLFALGLEPLMKWVAGLGIFKKQINEAVEARKAMNSVTLQGDQNAQGELTALRINMKVIQDSTVPLQKRQDMYQQMQKDYPAYFKNLSFEQVQAGKTGGAYDKLTQSIMASARAQAYKDKITENASKVLENDEKLLELKIKQSEQQDAADKNRRGQQSSLDTQQRLAFEKAAKDRTDAARNIQREIEAIEKDSSKILKQSAALEAKATTDTGKGVVTPLDKPATVKVDTEFNAQKALQKSIDDLVNQSLTKQMDATDQAVENVRLEFLAKRKEVEEYYKTYKKYHVDATGLEAAEAAKILTIINQQKEAEQEIREKAALEEAEQFKVLLSQFQTFADQKEAIILETNEAADQLIKNGYDEQAKVAIANGKKQLEGLYEQKAEELATYKTLFENIGELSKKRTSDALNEFRAQALAVGLPIEAIDKLIAKFNELNDKSLSKKRSEELNRIVEELSRVASEFANINGAVAGIASGLINAAKAYLQISKGLEDFKAKGASPEAKVAAGIGIAGAALAVVNSIVGYFKGLKKAKEEARKALSEFQANATKGEQEYQALLRKRDLDQVARGKNTYKSIVAQLDLLKAQSPKIQAAFDKVYASLQGQSSVSALGSKQGTLLRKAKTWDIMASLAGADYSRLEQLYTQGKLKDQAKADFESLRALREELQAAGLQVEHLQNQLNELLTGTTTSGLADSLTALFENGKFAAQDFAASFEEIMRKAIVNSFRLKVMEDAMQPFYDEFASLFVSGTPTEDQIAALKDKYNALGAQLGQQFKDLEKITGQNLQTGADKGSGLRGGISQSITETTGTALLGSSHGIQHSAREILNESRRQTSLQQQCVAFANENLKVALKIEANTYRTANNTGDAIPHLQNIANNTRDSSATLLRAAGKFGY